MTANIALHRLAGAQCSRVGDVSHIINIIISVVVLDFCVCLL